MKIFIDSADLDEIKQFYTLGIADGITTNPSLIKAAVDKRKKDKHKLDLKSYLTSILILAKGTPVSLEVTQTTLKGMVEEGKKLYQLFNSVAGNVVIKIPINPAFSNKDQHQLAGIAAIKALTKLRIPINCTLVFTPEQALLAAKAGAVFVSPFAGRIDDYLRSKVDIKYDKADYYPAAGRVDKIDKNKIIHDQGIVSGIDLIRQCVLVLKKYNFKTQVLAASLRNPRQVREAALVGVDIATLPFSVIQEMVKHTKTYEGMKKFTEDVVPEYVKLK